VLVKASPVCNSLSDVLLTLLLLFVPLFYIQSLMVAFRVEDLPMESQMLSDALDTAQKRVEAYFFDIRK
jgi:preprotein translocase subunit SecA